MANEQMKICSTPYVIRKLQMKTTRYHDTAVQNKTSMLEKMWNNKNTHSLLVRMQNGTATSEDGDSVLQS